jgi:molecular chaperone HtpG
MTDPVDEIWLQAVDGFKGLALRDAAKGELDLAGEEEKEKAREAMTAAGERLRPLLDYLGNRLSARVREVRLSRRLVDSPACLVHDERDPSPQFARVLASLGQDAPQSRRILELNPEHPVIRGMAGLLGENAGTAALEAYADLLYGLASLAEGTLPEDAPSLSRRLSGLLEEQMDARAKPGKGILPE